MTNQYDSLNRLIVRGYPDGGLEHYLYSAKGLIAYTNQTNQVTLYTYDALLRKTTETNGNNEGIQFVYSPAGELTSLTDGKGQQTSWKYDEYGRATNKTDAASNIIFRYKYDANGRPTSRWTPEKLETTYTNDAVGNVTMVNYPSSTDLTFAYDALNRVTNMTDSVGTTRFTFNTAGLLATEDGPWASDTVSLAYSSRLRTALNLAQANAADWAMTYGYDAARRATNVTSPAGAFGYNYAAGLGGITSPSPLVRRISLPNVSYITNGYDSVARLLATHLRNSRDGLVNQHDYVYNAANQRTKQTRVDGSFAEYTYDNIGQLSSALAKESEGTTNRWHERFYYGYDKAGNLSNRVQNVLTNVFHVNSLNQLTSVVRTNTSMTVAGTTFGAATNVMVADNGNSPVAATRYADATFTRTNVTLANGTNTFVAVAQDNLGRGDTNTVVAYLPTATTFLYDLNGNLTNHGVQVLAYDDENELTSITVAGRWRAEFAYDGKLRLRIEKNYRWNGGTWIKTNEVRFIYDGNVVLQERDELNVARTTLTRGLDLSGTWQGAGGIGGLLAATDHRTPVAEHIYFHSDGGGNVTAMVDGQQRSGGRYLYDPFGNMLSGAGPRADWNRYRFSSKLVHGVSGMYNYLYRWYTPEVQRWPNRDPISESGFLRVSGVNLRVRRWSAREYGFVLNSPLQFIDADGLWQICCHAYGPFTHCDLRDWPCDPADTTFPVQKNCNPNSKCPPKLDNGKDCCDATQQDIDDCLKRNPYDKGTSCPGSNCQANTLERLGSCCLKSPWKPSWYAYPTQGFDPVR